MASNISSNLPEPPTPSTPVQAETATREVQQNELVSGNINRVLDDNNKFIQDARARGVRSAAARGLQNSSIGVQAGEAGAISAALPIAQGDASAYREAAASNQLETGQTNRFNTGEANTSLRQGDQFGYDTQLTEQRGNIDQTLQENQFGYDTQLTEQRGNIDLDKLDAQFGYDTQLAEQRFDYDKLLLDIGQNNAVELQNLQNDFLTLTETNAVANDIVKGTLAAINTIVATPGITPEEITQATDIIIDQSRTALTVMGSDLSDIFPEVAQPAGTPPDGASNIVGSEASPAGARPGEAPNDYLDRVTTNQNFG